MAGNDGYTKLLIGSNTTQGSTTFTDTSVSGGHTVTGNGSAIHSTTQEKFGSSSMYFETAGSSYLSVPDSADWTFGSGDFTIDCWVNCDRTTTLGLWGQGNTADAKALVCWIRDDGSVTFGVISGPFDVDVTTAAGLITNDTWHHIACVKYGTSYRIYIDGVLRGSVISASTPFDVDREFVIGCRNEATSYTYFYEGYIDEFRVSKGIARWTSNFTPPTAAYTSIDYTIAGSLNNSARVLVINEDDWSLGENSEESVGDYEVITTSGSKTVVAVDGDGEVLGYGDVTPGTISYV